MKARPFRFYRQLESMDCGPTCLRMVARHYGRELSLPMLREKAGIDRQGVSMVGLCDAAEAIGLRATAAAATFGALAEERPFPAIVHWRRNHFVVLYEIDRKQRAHIADPAHGLARLSREEFEGSLDGPLVEGEKEGTILFFQPGPDFYGHAEQDGPVERARGLRALLRYLLPYRGHLAQLGFGMAAASLISLALAFLNQSLVDVGISGHNLGFVNLVLVAQLALFAGAAAGEFSKSWLTLHLGTRINVAMASDFLAKLTRLPMAFFDGKMTGDLMQRMSDLERVQTFVTSTLLSTAFMVVNLAVYSALLVRYDPAIFGIFVGGSALYVGWILAFLRRRKALDYRRFEASAGNQSGLISFIQGMQEIKMHNAERRHRWKWERVQVRLFRVNMSALALEQWQNLGSVVIHRLKNILITFVAARAVVSGDITLGMMMTIQFVLGNLEGPVTALVGFVRSFQDTRIGVERIGEVFGRDDEETGAAGKIAALPADHSIHVRGVGFRYGGPSSPQVLRGVDLVIPQGGVTAIVGASGSGKTTLVKLLLKHYAPTEGAVRIGGHDAQEYRNGFWRSQCGVVMQDGCIFTDTIAGNVCMADETPDKRRLLYAVKVANIQEFIEGLPLGYDTVIGSEGIRLSGGQRQRILIARAVYRDPRYLFFDEATSSLDAENERIIMENLHAFYRGRTVVIVAHRLSTVKHADQIVVMRGGELIERGTHESLTRARGAYFSLIRNQLEMGS